MISEKLKQIRKILGINQAEFSKSLEMSQSYLSDIESGRQEPSFAVIKKINKAYKVSIDWLLTDTGEMFLKEDSESSVKLPVDQELTDPEIQLLTFFRELNVDNQNELTDYAKFKYERNNPIYKSNKVKEPKPVYNIQKELKVTYDVPLLGSIAAGNPIFADDNIEATIRIPQDLVNPHGRKLFALKIKGDSMIGAGIYSGDYALIREVISPRDEVANGEIIAAVIGTEATLKRAYFDDSQLILKAENPAFNPIICNESDGCRVAGVLVLSWRWWEK